MAIIKPTALISGIKGNMGGSNFYQGQYGNVMRLKGRRRRKKCYKKLIAAGVDEQSAAHDCNQLGLVASGWGDLEAGEKAQWNATAQTVTWYNRFGDPYAPSGYLLYMQLSMNNWRTAGRVLGAVPVLVSAPLQYTVLWATDGSGAPSFDIPMLGDLANFYVVFTVLREWPGSPIAPLGDPIIPSNSEVKRNGNATIPFDCSLIIAPIVLEDMWLNLYGAIPEGVVSTIAVNYIDKTTGQSFVGSTHQHTWP